MSFAIWCKHGVSSSVIGEHAVACYSSSPLVRSQVPFARYRGQGDGASADPTSNPASPATLVPIAAAIGVFGMLSMAPPHNLSSGRG